MTEREINEYLERHLFGRTEWLYRGTNCCGTFWTNDEKVCKSCGEELRHEIEYDNHIENWQAVVERLLELEEVWSVDIEKYSKYANNKLCTIHYSKSEIEGHSNTIGQAVCRAAIEYLKAVAR